MIKSTLILRTEKAMAPHSSTLAWKIPWMEVPVRLQSMGSLRVGHDRATSLSLFSFMHWSRLLPCPSCCKQCCDEPWGTCIFFNYGFLKVYAQ